MSFTWLRNSFTHFSRLLTLAFLLTLPVAAVAAAAIPVDALGGTPLVLDELVLPTLGTEARFGHALAVSGNTLFVGAPNDTYGTGAGTVTGAVYVYRYDPSTGKWELLDKLVPPLLDATDGMRFGWSVAIDGGTALIGAPDAVDSSGNDDGKAYVFELDGFTWNATDSFEKLPYPDPPGYKTEYDFGKSVAIDGGLAIVGAPKNGVLYNACGLGSHRRETGAVYFYENLVGSWSLIDRVVTEPDLCSRQRYGRFAESVAAAGSLAFVGQPAYDYYAYYNWACPNGNDGRVRVYAGATQVDADVTIEDGGDVLDPYGHTCLTPANNRHNFARAVAAREIGGELYLMAGAPTSRIAGGGRGKTYLLRRTPGGPQPWVPVMNKVGRPNTRSGSAVALGDRFALIGAPEGDGEALLFDHVDGSGDEDDYVVLSAGHNDERFGSSVALTPTHAFFGAPERLVGSSGRVGMVYVTTLPAPAVIEYRFDNPADFDNGWVRNRAGSGYDGRILTDAPRQERGALGNAIAASDSLVVEAEDSSGVSFPHGLSVEAFVRRDSDASYDTIASKWTSGASSETPSQFALFFTAGELSGRLIFFVRTRDGALKSVTFFPPDNSYLGEWIHVAATYDGSGTLRLYWNGELASETVVSASGISNGTAPIRVGDLGSGSTSWSSFSGALDEVKIWDRELSADEIAVPLRPRVLVLKYDSTDPQTFDPATISQGLIAALADASTYLRPEIVEWVDTGVLPPQRPGGGFDYAGVFTDYDVCGRAGRGEIHEVWVWGGGDGGLLEWAVNGPWREAYGVGVGMPQCDIQVTAMGFNYTRSLALAMHSTGHRIEKNGLFYWGERLWDSFDGQRYRYDYTDPNQPPLQLTGNHCGNVHFPPNADQHNEYSSTDVVTSNCDDWHTDESGAYVDVNCETWVGPGCVCTGPDCEEETYLRWWMAHLPGPTNSNGPGDVRIQSWWTTFAE